MLKVENLMLGDTKEIESLIQAKQQISAILRGLVIYVQQLEAGNFSSKKGRVNWPASGWLRACTMPCLHLAVQTRKIVGSHVVVST